MVKVCLVSLGIDGNLAVAVDIVETNGGQGKQDGQRPQRMNQQWSDKDQT